MDAPLGHVDAQRLTVHLQCIGGTFQRLFRGNLGIYRPARVHHIHVGIRFTVVRSVGEKQVPARIGHHHVRPRQAEVYRAKKAQTADFGGVDDLYRESTRGVDHPDENGVVIVGARGFGRFAVHEHRPDLRTRRQLQTQKLAAAVAHG